MRILKRHRMQGAASLLCALLPLLAHGEDDPGPAREKESAYVLRTYDVKSITSTRSDFPGPQVLYPDFPGDGSAMLNPFAAVSMPTVTAADLATLIQERLLPEEFASIHSSILEQNGNLVVLQTPEVHAKIARHLRSLRRTFGRRISVQALEVAVDAAEAVRWIGQAGKPVPGERIKGFFDNAGGAKVTGMPQVSAYQQQRTHAFSGKNVNYVAGLVSTFDGYGPRLATRHEGIVLDATPCIETSNKDVLLTLRYGHSAPATEGPERFVFAATEAMKDGDAEPAAGAACGRIELPRLEARRVRTTVKLPVATWVLAASMDPVLGAKEGSDEARYLLLFVRCEEILEDSGL